MAAQDFFEKVVRASRPDAAYFGTHLFMDYIFPSDKYSDIQLYTVFDDVVSDNGGGKL
jgi:hypothetical protein